MMNRLDGAPSLPIKDEVDLAIDARAKEILREYDVTPEEAAQMARADVMRNMDQSGSATPAAALAGQHQAAGASPERARKLAEDQVKVYGPQGAWGLYRENEAPGGLERLQKVHAEQDAADARHQKMYDDWFTVTNMPSHQRALPETERQWADTERYVREQARLRRAGLHPNTPVDPIDPSARYKSDEEADRKKASRDAHMDGVFKNIRQRYGEEEEAAARDAYSRGEIHVPQKSAQRSRNEYRKNLEYTAMGDGDNADESRQRLRAMEAGVNYDDLTPDEQDALRARGGNMSAEREDRMMRRLRNQAGLTGQTDNAAYNDAGMLRELIAGNREAKREQNETMWRARAMLRGGNAVGAQALPGLNDWQRQRISGGPTPLDVEARRAPAENGQADRENALAIVERKIAAEAEQREAQLAEARRQHEERMLQQTQQFELSRQEAAAREAEAARRHSLLMENAKADREAAAATAAGRDREWQSRLGWEQNKTEQAIAMQEEARKRAEREQLIASYEASYGPGVRSVIAGDVDTPEAQAALEAMAARADQSWTGFYNADAVRLNAILDRIGVADPKKRREIVEKYGLGPMAAVGPGGRSGPVSAFFNWISGPPQYLP